MIIPFSMITSTTNRINNNILMQEYKGQNKHPSPLLGNIKMALYLILTPIKRAFAFIICVSFN